MADVATNLDLQSRLGSQPRSTLLDGVRGKRVWIDLDNSPHVPFFVPILERLEASGCSVLVTARDCFQVCELADLMHLEYRRVGRHYGKNTLRKLAGLCWRARQLAPHILSYKPQLALSHGSRSQLLLANLLGIPSVTIADYEFARIWMLVRPDWVITPEVIPGDKLRVSKERLLHYPGIKEDVYVPRFRPDAAILTLLGLEQPSDLIVVIRPPATEAHYHRPETDELFAAVVNYLGLNPQVKMVLLPRGQEQGIRIQQKWEPLFASGKIRIPDRVLDGLNLIWHSDLVISGGGTMNREAAALGVPVYSIFRGETGAVDRYLASTGRLIMIERPQDVSKKLVLTKRDRSSPAGRGIDGTLTTIVEHVQTILKQVN